MTVRRFCSTSARVILLVALTLLLTFLSGRTSAIHEDEQGKFDWMLPLLGNVEHVALSSDKDASHVFLASSEGVVGKVDVTGEHGGKLLSRAFLSSTPRCLVESTRRLFVLLEDGRIEYLHGISLARLGSIQLELQAGEIISSASCLVEGERSRKVSVFAVIHHTLTSAISFRRYEFETDHKEFEPYAPLPFPALPVPANFKKAFMTSNYVVVQSTTECSIFDRPSLKKLETHNGECRNFVKNQFVLHWQDQLGIHVVGVRSTYVASQNWRCEDCDLHFFRPSGYLVPVSFFSLDDDFYFEYNKEQRVLEGLGQSTFLTFFPQENQNIFLLKTASHNIVAVTTTGKVLWTRPEALAFAKSITIMERPGVQDHFLFSKDVIVFGSSGAIFSVPADHHGEEVRQVADVQQRLLAALDAPSIADIEVEEMTEISRGQVRGSCRYGRKKAIVSLTFHADSVESEVTKIDEDALVSTPGFVVRNNYTVDPPQHASSQEQYVFTVNVSSGSLAGFVIKGDHAIPTWNTQLSAPFVSYATVSDLRHVFFHNNLRLYPNKTKEGELVYEVRRRYPTQNIVAVAYYEVHDVTKISTLVVVVVDTITGSVHGVSRHENVEGEAKLLITENVVLYYFLDAKKMRYCMGVWELYQEENDLPVLKSSGVSPVFAIASFFQKKEHTFSSRASQPPMVKVHALGVYGGPLAVLGVTTSFQSIARKNVILVFESGRVGLLQLNMLLRGSPVFFKNDEMVALEKKRTQILIPPTLYPTHRYRVAYPKHLAVSPTGLESSNHIAVSGLDVFYVRYSAGKAFDLLNNDFDKRLLVLLVVGITVSCIVARFFAKRKMLGHSWN